MNKLQTDGDKILQAILSNEEFARLAKYEATKYDTIESALSSDNAIVVAVAKVIDCARSSMNDREIYNVVTNYLKENL